MKSTQEQLRAAHEKVNELTALRRVEENEERKRIEAEIVRCAQYLFDTFNDQNHWYPLTRKVRALLHGALTTTGFGVTEPYSGN